MPCLPAAVGNSLDTWLQVGKFQVVTNVIEVLLRQKQLRSTCDLSSCQVHLGQAAEKWYRQLLTLEDKLSLALGAHMGWLPLLGCKDLCLCNLTAGYL